MRSRSRSPVRRDRRHSRSRSHSRERYERRDDRYRDRDRKRDDRKRSRSRSPVKRNRSPRRSRSRSPRRRDKDRERDKSRYSDRSRDISPKRGQRSEEPSGIQSKATGVEPAPGSDEDEDMMKKMMGFTGFDSTKGKHVKGQMDGAVKISRTKKYRQYMNRRGGFNRPLDHVN